MKVSLQSHTRRPPSSQTPAVVITAGEDSLTGAAAAAMDSSFVMIKCIKELEHLKQVLTRIITTGTSLSAASFHHLLHLAASKSRQSLLLLLFIQFRHLVDTAFCNALIGSCSRSNGRTQSLLVYATMLRAAVPPDSSTFPSLVKSAAQLHLPALGLPLHGCAIKYGVASDTFVSTALVSMYCAFGRVDEGRKLFDEMPQRNTVSWNAMLTGYVHNRRFVEAHALFSEMLASGTELGEVTVVCALSACAHVGALSQGVWIHDYIKHHGLSLNVFVGTALIDMYMKCGEVTEASEVFRAMKCRNVYSWNAFISGLAMNGKGDAAMEAFDAMTKENLRPDAVTFLGILCACCHQGLVDKGRRLFVDMECKFGLRPKIEHYGCMVDLLGRAGLLEEASQLIKKMPMKADAAVWRALLAGCRIHGDARLGEEAIRKLLELEPHRGENYVLLSNILARERRWTEVGELRLMMSKMGITKVPGCSSIEIDNVVYEFVVTSQAEKDGLDEVFAMLAKMKRELMLAGYSVDTEFALYDLEEEEKENSLLHHSEKLALAFGLLKSQHGAIIRIVKNLRVCKDCHAFFKLVSKLYQREIVVRDRNRFHHFDGGVCSCRDYW